MKTFKGKGEHSVNDLEEMVIEKEEALYQKQLINQELLEALRALDELFNEGGCQWVRDTANTMLKGNTCVHELIKKSINKAL